MAQSSSYDIDGFSRRPVRPIRNNTSGNAAPINNFPIKMEQGNEANDDCDVANGTEEAVDLTIDSEGSITDDDEPHAPNEEIPLPVSNELEENGIPPAVSNKLKKLERQNELLQQQNMAFKHQLDALQAEVGKMKNAEPQRPGREPKRSHSPENSHHKRNNTHTQTNRSGRINSESENEVEMPQTTGRMQVTNAHCQKKNDGRLMYWRRFC